MSQYWDDGFYSQPTTSELKRKSDASRKNAEKKGKVLEPVVIQGRKVAKSWWGQAWCANLERYADYESRLERGRRYVKTGAVIDLKIGKGRVQARVQGSRRTPYKVENLEKLLAGDFPAELKELFMERDGLFPAPKEISFSCSCPDWALMCKHVAASLYGVGNRLDQDPSLFFTLRGIEMGRFIDVAIANRVELMLKNASRSSGRIISDGEIRGLFGV